MAYACDLEMNSRSSFRTKCEFSWLRRLVRYAIGVRDVTKLSDEGGHDFYVRQQRTTETLYASWSLFILGRGHTPMPSLACVTKSSTPTTQTLNTIIQRNPKDCKKKIVNPRLFGYNKNLDSTQQNFTQQPEVRGTRI